MRSTSRGNIAGRIGTLFFGMGDAPDRSSNETRSCQLGGLGLAFFVLYCYF
jgi:hypothetical protein